jgi:hypothetical protein
MFVRDCDECSRIQPTSANVNVRKAGRLGAPVPDRIAPGRGDPNMRLHENTDIAADACLMLQKRSMLALAAVKAPSALLDGNRHVELLCRVRDSLKMHRESSDSLLVYTVHPTSLVLVSSPDYTSHARSGLENC